GKKLNKPSDDPLGAVNDLGIRTDLAKNAQYQKNINQAQTWVGAYDSALSEAKNLIDTANEIAIAMANDTYDETARLGAAQELESILTAMTDLANTEVQGKYVFSGFRTDDKAIVSTANGVQYAGDDGQIMYGISSSANMMVNLSGADVFLDGIGVLGSEGDINPGINTATLLSDLNGGLGVDLAVGTFRITDETLGISVDVDVSAATDINDVVNEINAQLAANVPPITNVTAAISPAGNSLILETTETGLISTSTPLSSLNQGNGVDMTFGSISLTDGAAVNLDIDLSGASTVDDVITIFNAAVAADPTISNVTMQVNAAGTGLEIVDANGVPMGLSVVEVHEDSTTAANLGLTGPIDPTLTGTDLNPQLNFSIEEIGGTTAADLGILTDFSTDHIGADLNPLLTVDTPVADLNSGTGLEMGEIVIWQGDQSRTIDLGSPAITTVQDVLDALNNSGLDITASLNDDGTGIQIVNNDPYSSLTVEDVGDGKTSKSLGIYGSSDMMGTLTVLTNALKNNDQEGISMLLGNLEASRTGLLNQRATVGAKGVRLDDTSARLIDLEYTLTTRLSEVEDADLTKVLTQLSEYDTNYRASLIASSSIIQQSLLDFLK
ncbi:MAG: flagellar hook-associated protein FlgL, partial [candidate division Zixibacteria bacterium]|nr:flagellar hook-associated protein FlgL [candidate division Zixibacteria bacterium]